LDLLVNLLLDLAPRLPGDYTHGVSEPTVVPHPTAPLGIGRILSDAIGFPSLGFALCLLVGTGAKPVLFFFQGMLQLPLLQQAFRDGYFFDGVHNLAGRLGQQLGMTGSPVPRRRPALIRQGPRNRRQSVTLQSRQLAGGNPVLASGRGFPLDGTAFAKCPNLGLAGT
jgi:hypothetical protein